MQNRCTEFSASVASAEAEAEAGRQGPSSPPQTETDSKGADFGGFIVLIPSHSGLALHRDQ